MNLETDLVEEVIAENKIETALGIKDQKVMRVHRHVCVKFWVSHLLRRKNADRLVVASDGIAHSRDRGRLDRSLQWEDASMSH